jgi:hypothetical protein
MYFDPLKHSITNERIKKMWYVYTMEYYSAIKRRNYIIHRKMGGTGDHQAEQDDPSSKRQISYVFAYM